MSSPALSRVDLRSVEDVQADLEPLPPHIRAIDLLHFRRVEKAHPSGWEALASACRTLARAINDLRPEGTEPLMPAVTLLGDPELMALHAGRFDALTVETLRELQRAAAARDPEAPGARDPARLQLAALLEERLIDLMLEIQFVLRRARRRPRRPPNENPFLSCLETPARGLTPRAREHLLGLAHDVGPLPGPIQESFVKSARGANIA